MKAVTARVNITMAEDERFFVNGYQTWTYCPEQGRHGFTRGMGKLPKFVIDKFGIDRYGDYFFVDYPQTPGVMHGESYCYFPAAAGIIGSSPPSTSARAIPCCATTAAAAY